MFSAQLELRSFRHLANCTHLIALALVAKVPVASTSSEFAKAGALVSKDQITRICPSAPPRSSTKFYAGQILATSPRALPARQIGPAAR